MRRSGAPQRRPRQPAPSPGAEVGVEPLRDAGMPHTEALQSVPRRQPLADRMTDAIVAKIRQAASLYHQLVLVVGPAGAGKSKALASVRKRTGAPVLNLGLALSRRMLDLTVRQITDGKRIP